MHIEQKDERFGWNLDNSYGRLPKIFFSSMHPTAVTAPELVLLNETLAVELGLNPLGLREEKGVFVLVGNKVPQGTEPLAQAYAGHQFGHFTMLGDGRALLLGEQITPELRRVDLQWKGCGRTPYSRRGDGRAALGPMLREYIISEAMAALGIPTTRSLAVTGTGEDVHRETPLPGAVLVRTAASHIRVGTFEYAAHWGTTEDLRALTDYAIKRHYPDIREAKQPYLAFLQAVIQAQASLISKWQLVGFIHGVMNTDNMTISGETIDYGPCAFMDVYDPKTVFSSIDANGRYAYGNQPAIGAWNLARFAETLLPLLHPEEEKAIAMAQEAVSGYEGQFREFWLSGMRAKLGLSGGVPEDAALIEDLLYLIQEHQADFTNTFRGLSVQHYNGEALFASKAFAQWRMRWMLRIGGEDGYPEAQVRMAQVNPAVIPRNHRVEAALNAAVKNRDLSEMMELLKVLENPYAYTGDQYPYMEPPPADACRYRTFCGT